MENVMRASLFTATILAAIFAVSPANAQSATGGSGYLQFWQCRQDASSTLNTSVTVTNTSTVDLNLAVTFYGMTGAVVTSGQSYVNFNGSTIPAGHTVLIGVSCTTQNFGIAKIEWSGNAAQKPLLATGIRNHTSSSGSTQQTIAVNNNMPF